MNSTTRVALLLMLAAFAALPSGASAYVQNWACGSASSGCQNPGSSEHSFTEARAMRNPPSVQSICADATLNGNPVATSDGQICAQNNTFRRSCATYTSVANRRGYTYGSGPWAIDSRAATWSDHDASCPYFT